MPSGVVYVWYLSIMCLAEGTAGEDVGRGEARRFGNTVEKENLVRGRYEEHARTCQQTFRVITKHARR